MKAFSLRIMCILAVCITSQLSAQETLSGTGHLPTLLGDQEPNTFPLVSLAGATPLVASPEDDAVVRIAEKAFAGDEALVTGQTPRLLSSTNTLPSVCVLAGTLNHSELIDRLVSGRQIEPDKIRGKWECFIMKVVEHPLPGVKQALVIVGSDRRGTAYGILELSRLIGVSPLVWWADVTPTKRSNLLLTPCDFASNPPGVKYRGIFLNDEDWALQPWAASKMDPEIKDIGPRTYAHIFELLLRLRANLIWPAMHACTKAFYYYPENPKTADDYAIIVGSSHAEPMLRNNVFEWKTFLSEPGQKPGEYRYDTNSDQVNAYWREKVRLSSPYESIYTVGMRGIHDSPMVGPKNDPEKVALLTRVISNQQQILSDVLAKPISLIPQIFCPYKEVLGIYRAGLKVPDDVTIVWPDDNHGYIRQLSNPEEQKRSGGSGVYYHLSYYGAPEDYLWLCSTSPELISYEVQQGMAANANRLWVFNVGDLKPAEMETEFAMDLLWNPSALSPVSSHLYIRDWAARTFGENYADQVAAIKDKYYLLAQEGKPEHLWRVEYGREQAEARLDQYKDLEAKAKELAKQIPPPLQDAYFELILYPVLGATKMNEKVLCAKLGRMVEAEKAFQEIQDLTHYYNNQLAGGKWNRMMDWEPRKQTAFAEPTVFTQSGGGPALTTTHFVPVNLLETAAIHNEPGGALIQFPYLGAPFAIGRDPLSTNTLPSDKASYVEYTIMVKPGKHTFHVHCLPGHPLYTGLKYRIGLTLNQNPMQLSDLDAAEFSDPWQTNVLRGYAESSVSFTATDNETVSLRLSFPDPGLVVTSILVD